MISPFAISCISIGTLSNPRPSFMTPMRSTPTTVIRMDPAPQQAGAPKYDRGDDIELDSSAIGRGGRVNLGSLDDPGDAGGDGADDVSEQFYPPHSVPAEVRRPLVVANRQDRKTEGGPVLHECGNGDHDCEQEHRHGNSADESRADIDEGSGPADEMQFRATNQKGCATVPCSGPPVSPRSGAKRHSK
jgi:hypothetical protein